MANQKYDKLIWNLIPTMASFNCFDSDYAAIEALKSVYFMLTIMDGDDCLSIDDFIGIFCSSFNSRYNIPQEKALKAETLLAALPEVTNINITLGGDLIESALEDMD